MTIRQVLRMGHPTLLQTAQPVTEFNSPEIYELIQDMFDTMNSMDGAGLAAPQIGENKRVVIFGFDSNSRYPAADPIPMTVLINPVIEALEDEMEEGWEGCLSLPGLRGTVPRYKKIRYTGVDQTGAAIDRIAEGFHARVVQHEVDHLNGILYPSRIRDIRKFGFIEELIANGEISDPR